jgi:uncharacterized protein YqgC (DUF456 family)
VIVDVSGAGLAVTIVAGVLILLGIAGVVVPALPGLVLSWAGVLIWAIFAGGGVARWTVVAIVSVLAVIGLIVKFVWPHRRLRQTGVPMRSIVVGAVFGIIGFFVIPIAGLVIGFVLGIFVAEYVRLANAKDAWPSTKAALKAVGLALIIELFMALTIGFVWVVGVVVA